MTMRPVLRLSLLALVLALSLRPDVSAQPVAGRGHLQLGIAAIPGIGSQAVYVQPRSLYTVEGALYADLSPSFAGGEGTLQVAAGIGGALRIFGIARALGGPTAAESDFDFGFRIGPALFFAFGESSRAGNPFSLFLEPYGRFSTQLTSRRSFFAEVGLQRPILRAGFLIGL